MFALAASTKRRAPTRIPGTRFRALRRGSPQLACPVVEATHDGLDSIRRTRLPLLLVLGAVAVALFPWTAYLSATLPSRHVAHHWDIVWVGFDLFEALALAATVIALARCSPRIALIAAVAGTALLS